MKKTASRYLKGLMVAAVLCAVFVAGVCLDMSLRVAKTVPIPVDSSEVPEVTITASRMPDFFWVGNAWWIDYESPVPFDLDIGSGSATQVPAGTHEIFANHDNNNLDQYGLRLSKDFPESIVARPTGHSKAQ